MNVLCKKPNKQAMISWQGMADERLLLSEPARRSAILKLSGLYIQRAKSGFTTAKEAATKMDRRTWVRKKRSPAEETGLKYRRVHKIGHNDVKLTVD